MLDNATLAQATRKLKASDREINYTWRSKNQNIEVDGDQWGGYVNLRISHNSDRKEFSAFIQFAHYNTSRGYESIQYTIFDNVNYPSGTVATQPIARYSAKALDEFEARVIEYLNGVSQLGGNGAHGAVCEAWARATEIAMGGDGTLRYSEALSM
jgi:hypothetical protein